MLETLDQIDWASLTHAYGAASDVPEMLRGLATDEEEIREGALGGLYGTIWHQGTVYQATAYAVPFLVELLEAPSVKDKPRLLILLRDLAMGSSFLDVHQRLDHYRSKRNTPEFIIEREKELAEVRAAHDAVVEGAPVYLRLMGHSDHEVRTAVPCLLADCTEAADAIGPALGDRLTLETDTTVRISICLALGRIGGQAARVGMDFKVGSAERSQLLSIVDAEQGEGTPGVRLAAALALVELSDAPIPPGVLMALRKNLADGMGELEKLPWSKDDPLEEISSALCEQPGVYLQILLELLTHPLPLQRCRALYAVREACRKRRDAAKLAAPQLGALLADGSGDVRKGAAIALAEIGSAAALVEPELLVALERFADDDSAEMRLHAAAALCKLGNAHALPHLLALLPYSKIQSKALAAIKALGSAAAPAVPHLLRLLRGTQDVPEQARLAHALAAMGPSAYEALPDLLNVLQNPPTASGVAAALGSWGPSAREAVPQLQALLGAENLHTRRAAAKALGEIGSDAQTALTALALRLQDDDSTVRVYAARALWQIARLDDVALPILMSILEKDRGSRNPAAQHAHSYAAEALGLMGPTARPAVPLLSELLTSDLHWTRIRAACALWKVGCTAEEILPTLLEELQCRPAGHVVLECLGDMGRLAISAVPALQQIAESEVRLVDGATFDTWVDDDEAFLAAAFRALERIQATG